MSEEKSAEHKEEKKGEEEKVEPKKIKKGDYIIQVHVIEARDLKGRDFGDTSDPVCEVSVMEQKKSTSIHQKCNSCIFDERLYFDFKNLEVEELNQGKCIIEVFDANMLRRNVLIGSFEFDLVSVYYKPHNELYKQWVALTDITDQNEGVQGYLQVTIIVLGPDDEQYIHPPEEEFASDSNGLLNVMMPPQIEQEPQLLRAHIYRLEKLAALDTLINKSSDPYVQIKFAGVTNITTKFSKTLDVKIHETVTVPVMEPVLSDQIIVYCLDYDKGPVSDDIIGTCTYSYKSIKSDPLPTHWVHFYGSHASEKGKEADKMNRNIIEGTHYRGSMLLRLDVQKHDDPKAEVRKALWNDQMEPKLCRWVLQIDAYQAVEVKNLKGKFALEMHIRDIVITTDYSDCNRGMCEWYEVLKLPGSNDSKEESIILTMPEDPKQCPDVIFYIVEKGEKKPVSYRRFKWTELIKYKFTTPPSWYPFKNHDLLQKLSEEEFPGTALIGIRCGREEEKPPTVPIPSRPFLNIAQPPDNNEEELSVSISVDDDQKLATNGDYQQLRSRSTGMSMAPNNQLQGEAATIGELTIIVVSANSVPALDRGGTSDPFVELELNGDIKKSTIKEKNLSPTWNESFVFKGVSIHDSFNVRLYDRNKVTRDNKIGEKGGVLLMSLLQTARGVIGQDWNCTQRFLISEKYPDCSLTLSFSFKFDPNQLKERKKEERGGLRQLFQQNTVISQARINGVALMGRPYPKYYQMRLYVYVARDLDAKDNNGLSDPYIEIKYCGQKAKTKILKETLNPQWMEELAMNVDVPQPSEFAPRMQIAVYDWDRLSGRDLIGRFFIPFLEVEELMRVGKPRWYNLEGVDGEKVNGKVYFAAEVIDPNNKKEKVFKIDLKTRRCYLHLLTIGVRGLKSALGINKPQVTYSVPTTAEQSLQISTDPSSNPEPSNANFLVVRKLQLDLPLDYELAPVLNIIAKDNLFGGLIDRVVGNGNLSINDFMDLIKNSPTNAWTIRETKTHILNEEELKAELKSEERAERREKEAEDRTIQLSVKKSILFTESRCENKIQDTKILESIDILEKSDIIIDDDEKEQNALFTSVDNILSSTSNVLNTVTTTVRKTIVNTDNTNMIEEIPKSEDGEIKIHLDKSHTEELKEKELLGQDEKELTEEEITKLQKEKQINDIKATEDEKAALLEQEQVSMEDIENDGAEVKTGKKKKLKMENEKKLQAWDKENEELCYDLDTPVKYNPEDFEPKYLKGRLKIGNELEDEMDVQPFESLDVWTGQAGGIKLLGQDRRNVGTIKGLWKLSEGNENPFGQGLKALVQTRTIAVRLYVLNGIHLFPMDRDGSSDPYLVVKLGKQKFSTRDRYIKNSLEPKFHEGFEFMTKLPGPSKLEVEVWDWDGLGDDLIGTTVIDIEDRWFSKDWRKMQLKPLEDRTLHNPRSNASYGKLRLWLDMMTKDEARNTPMIDISLPPKTKFELRVIIWQAKDTVIKDEVTDQNDLYVTAALESDDITKQETDTHWRAKFGRGSWNWRLLFPVELPVEKKSVFRLGMWDKDITAANDSIGEISFSLDALFREAFAKRETRPRTILRKDKEKRFWVELKHPNFEGVQARLQISIELLNDIEAGKLPAGIGRSDPNANPFLPPPEGRLNFSLNPFTMLKQLLGDKLCFKLYLIVCCLVFGVLLVFFGPQLFINFVSSAIF